MADATPGITSVLTCIGLCVVVFGLEAMAATAAVTIGDSWIAGSKAELIDFSRLSSGSGNWTGSGTGTDTDMDIEPGATGEVEPFTLQDEINTTD